MNSLGYHQRSGLVSWLVMLLALIVWLGGVQQTLAAWDHTPYDPGETLNPECAPTDTDCTVTAPAVSGANTDITGLAPTGNLTVSPTGNLLLNPTGNVGVGTSSPYAKLSVNGQTVSLYYTATSTSQASTFPYASTTALTVAGSTYLGSLTGPLQAIGGLVSATSTLSVAYGGTGLSTLPSYGNVLLGNAAGGYTLTATTSLGILPTQTGNNGKYLTTDGSTASWASIASSQWTTNSNDIYYTTGRVGVGTTTPDQLVTISGTDVDSGLHFETRDVSVTNSSNTGVTSPGSAASVTSGTCSGAGATAWSSASNALSSNDSYATASLGNGSSSQCLQVTNFGFSIPAGATIVGIKAEVERYASSFNTINDAQARLIKGGTVQSAEDKSNGSFWSISDLNSYVTYGGSSDTWTNSWTYSDINASNFGFNLIARNLSNPISTTASVDHIRMTVYYTTSTTQTYDYTLGGDYSDGGKFKISGSSALGTSDYLTIDTAGKVGIGTASPTNALSLVGAMDLTGAITSSYTSSASTFPYASTTALSATSIFASGNLDASTISLDAGSESAPAITGGQSNTGIYFTSNGDAVRLVGEGTEIERVNANGQEFNYTKAFSFANIGSAWAARIWNDGLTEGVVGFRQGTTPYTLRVYKTGAADSADPGSNYERLKLGWNGNTAELGAEAGGTGTLRSINLLGANVGVSTTTPLGKFSVASANSTAQQPLLVVASSSAAVATSTSLLINWNGNVGIASTTPWKVLSVNGGVSFSGLTSSGTGNALCISSSNEILNAGGGTCTPSSLKYKHDITDLDIGLEQLRLLRPVAFRFNETNEPRIGLIAEEVAKIEPRLVFNEADGQSIRGVRYEELTSLLVKSIQEIDKRVTDLAAGALSYVGDKLQAALAIFDRVETKTALISEGLEMVDQTTGQTYCVTINNGDWQKTPGACVKPAAPAPVTASAGTTNDQTSSTTPTSDAESNSQETASTTPAVTSDATTTPEVATTTDSVISTETGATGADASTGSAVETVASDPPTDSAPAADNQPAGTADGVGSVAPNE